jgi:hypothetical protein
VWRRRLWSLFQGHSPASHFFPFLPRPFFSLYEQSSFTRPTPHSLRSPYDPTIPMEKGTLSSFSISHYHGSLFFGIEHMEGGMMWHITYGRGLYGMADCTECQDD